MGIINSLSSENNEFVQNNIGKFDLLIVDECHKLGADNFRYILENWGDTSFILGLSATPDR